MTENLNKQWTALLQDEFQLEYFKELAKKLDVYRKETSDLLATVPVPAGTKGYQKL